MPATANIVDRDVVVVGAGFGGCYLLHLLREKGFSTTVLEAGKRTGGVWAWSCYPGARVDCELPYYGFSDPEIWSTWNWTERFPAYTELRPYFDHVANVWDLNRDIELDTRVIETRWEEDSKTWLVKTDAGQLYRCTWLIAATGTSFKQHIPDFKGKELYKGQQTGLNGLAAQGDPRRGQMVYTARGQAQSLQLLMLRHFTTISEISHYCGCKDKQSIGLAYHLGEFRRFSELWKLRLKVSQNVRCDRVLGYFM